MILLQVVGAPLLQLVQHFREPISILVTDSDYDRLRDISTPILIMEGTRILECDQTVQTNVDTLSLVLDSQTSIIKDIQRKVSAQKR